MLSQFNPNDKVLVLDFDHTCYDTDAFLMYEIRQGMINKFNIPFKSWEESYESSVRLGYSLEQHRNELMKVLKYEPFSLEEIQNFEKQINFGKYLYKDVISFLNKAKNLGYKMMLLSFGDRLWQDKKVIGVGLDKIMDIIHYTPKEGYKAEVLKKYVNNCKKVIFVENNGHDLDAVYKLMPNVETYFMSRLPPSLMKKEDNAFMEIRYAESRRIAKKKVLFSHKHCKSFDSIIL
jgi:FMN phosphatase YigB (HAD superfamily)